MTKKEAMNVNFAQIYPFRKVQYLLIAPLILRSRRQYDKPINYTLTS